MIFHSQFISPLLKIWGCRLMMASPKLFRFSNEAAVWRGRHDLPPSGTHCVFPTMFAILYSPYGVHIFLNPLPLLLCTLVYLFLSVLTPLRSLNLTLYFYVFGSRPLLYVGKNARKWILIIHNNWILIWYLLYIMSCFPNLLWCITCQICLWNIG